MIGTDNMKPQHTPGPWKVSPCGNIMKGGCKIATVEQMPGNYESERMANANICAAAPEMLLALESLLSDRRKPPYLTLQEWRETHQEFRATLRKAKGGE